MRETLYKKEMVGKRVRYTPVEEPAAYDSVIEFTDGQCVTVAGALGVTLLNLFERHIPPHKRIAKNIKAVETAVLNLYNGWGEPVDHDLLDDILKCWDRTMLEMSGGKV